MQPGAWLTSVALERWAPAPALLIVFLPPPHTPHLLYFPPPPCCKDNGWVARILNCHYRTCSSALRDLEKKKKFVSSVGLLLKVVGGAAQVFLQVVTSLMIQVKQLPVGVGVLLPATQISPITIISLIIIIVSSLLPHLYTGGRRKSVSPFSAASPMQDPEGDPDPSHLLGAYNHLLRHTGPYYRCICTGL